MDCAARALHLPPVAARAANSAHRISVLGTSDETVASFSSAKCTKIKSKEDGPVFFAHAVSTNGGYDLFVKVFAFKGVHREYEIAQGPIDPNPSLLFQPTADQSDASEYSNRFVPSYPSFGFGEVVFREAGRLLGVGYGPAMYSRDLADAVALTGVVECRYKARTKR
jgi:hypothetical protein